MMQPRPSMPGLAYVAGIQIKPPKALPSDIQVSWPPFHSQRQIFKFRFSLRQEFMDGASSDGVIYFSLGSCIRSIDLPRDKLNAFMDAFRLLKQRVLWKFENETIENLPPNVMIRKWLPQNDVLAHKNLKLFITHGGVFGTQEGIHYGVPMLFIPVYSDQFRNAMRCVHAGYAEMLRFADVRADKLAQKARQILDDSKYASEAKAVSALFRDNPIDPMEEAMYWIEYTARYQGTKAFKTSAVNLPLYVYLHLDILVAAVAAIALIWTSVSYALKSLKSNPLHSGVDASKKKIL